MKQQEVVKLSNEELNEQLVENKKKYGELKMAHACLLYTSPSPRDATLSRMPSSA